MGTCHIIPSKVSRMILAFDQCLMHEPGQTRLCAWGFAPGKKHARPAHRRRRPFTSTIVRWVLCASYVSLAACRAARIRWVYCSLKHMLCNLRVTRWIGHCLMLGRGNNNARCVQDGRIEPSIQNQKKPTLDLFRNQLKKKMCSSPL